MQTIKYLNFNCGSNIIFRHCRLISLATKKVVQRVYKSKIPTPPGSSLEGKLVRLFYDDTFKSFFRRLTFSIDGSLIFVPSGIIESQETTETISNAIIVFSRENIRESVLKCNDFKFCLKNNSNNKSSFLDQ